MKVKMQHTVDLEEVPVEVDRMMQTCIAKLKTISNITATVDSMDPEKFTERVDFIRRKLFDVDNSLEECATIMSGYQSAITDSGDVFQTPAQEPSPQPPYEVEE